MDCQMKSRAKTYGYVLERSMICLISIPLLPVMCHVTSFSVHRRETTNCKSSISLSRKMTPDEADAVVIGFSSPENLPTIGCLLNYHINAASTHLPAISTACRSEGLVAWRLNKPLIDSCAAAISLNHLNILKGISAKQLKKRKGNLGFLQETQRSVYGQAVANLIRDHLLALPCGLGMDKNLKMDWRREMVIALASLRISVTIHESLPLVQHETYLSSICFSNLKILLIPFSAFLSKRMQVEKLLDALVQSSECSQSLAYRYVLERSMICLISIPLLPVMCHVTSFSVHRRETTNCKSSISLSRKMTPDEADAVVIGFSSPENLPTIGCLLNYHINAASTHLPAISTACRSEGLVAWRLNKPLIDSCAAAISLNHLNILKGISAKQLKKRKGNLGFLQETQRSVYGQAVANLIRDHLLALPCGLGMDKNLKMDWRREMVIALASLRISVTIHESLPLVQHETYLSSICFSNLKILLIPFSAFLSKRMQVEKLLDALVQSSECSQSLAYRLSHQRLELLHLFLYSELERVISRWHADGSDMMGGKWNLTSRAQYDMPILQFGSCSLISEQDSY
ncbi:hypothetical protein C4D60_Mb07t10120 [Musa balbisiana]|uniref:Uncharacterized protein n=1 Tax=Musa balbisiana TaxID=52838 RepID=A0A4S8JEA2_MUSBA|nr:hypothetical protein C4D60_Mb07t10120 [Musa balbisiana]